MDERTVPVRREQPVRATDRESESAAGLNDPRALTILTTEHWSLLSARSLVYNEAFSRAGMFLTFLSATLVALGLVATQMAFASGLLLVAAIVLAVDLFVGVATMGRVATATSEDVRYLQGMNRIRHAYHELVPGLERYFIAGKHDDIRGVFEVYGAAEEIMGRAGILHGFTTVVGMIGVICAAVAGALAGVLALLVGAAPELAGIVAIAAFLIGVAASIATMNKQLSAFARTMRPVFPSPVPGDGSGGGGA
jgi:hypothetical protein